MLVYKLKNNRLKLFLLLISFTSLLGQQKFNFEQISIPAGLSNSTVWDILQDKYGFLWIATADGLNRYDGYTFKIYKNDPGDPKSLSNNLVYSTMIDAQGTLWVGTNSGLCKYDRANETFKTFLIDSTNANATSNIIINILQDSKKRIWIATAAGIHKFYESLAKFEKTFIKDGKN